MCIKTQFDVGVAEGWAVEKKDRVYAVVYPSSHTLVQILIV